VPPLSPTRTGRLLGQGGGLSVDAGKAAEAPRGVGVYRLVFAGSGLGYTSLQPMLWFTIWFLVILKIPIAYLGYVIWWAVKDPPAPSTGPGSARVESTDDGGGTGGPGLSHRPRKPIPGRRPGPHGVPVRRPQPLPLRERIARGA
jgi:hypothetical protein